MTRESVLSAAHTARSDMLPFRWSSPAAVLKNSGRQGLLRVNVRNCCILRNHVLSTI
jgi:hypothetical protein